MTPKISLTRLLLTNLHCEHVSPTCSLIYINGDGYKYKYKKNLKDTITLMWLLLANYHREHVSASYSLIYINTEGSKLLKMKFTRQPCS